MSGASISRRGFLKSSGLVFSFNVAGMSLSLTPAQAREQKADFRVLSKTQVASLDALADAIVPGSKEQGISHFIDSQLAVSETESLLMIKYLGVPAPYTEFYTSSLDSVFNALNVSDETTIKQPMSEKLEQLIDDMGQDQIESWQGPPASFFYFVLRSDALDVTYGTQRGFSELDIPYMAHIEPSSAW